MVKVNAPINYDSTHALAALQLRGDVRYRSVQNLNVDINGGAKTVIWTVPAGKKYLLLGWYLYNADAVTSATVSFFLGIGGVYWSIDGTKTMAAFNGSSPSTSYGNGPLQLLFEAGEEFAVTTTGDNVCVKMAFLEIDAALNAHFKRYSATGLINGDNTIFTVPAGKIFVPLWHRPEVWGQGYGGIFAVPSAGANPTVQYFHVPSGSARVDLHKVSSATVNNNLQLNRASLALPFEPGDKLMTVHSGIALSDDDGLYWLNGMEINA